MKHIHSHTHVYEGIAPQDVSHSTGYDNGGFLPSHSVGTAYQQNGIHKRKISADHVDDESTIDQINLQSITQLENQKNVLQSANFGDRLNQPIGGFKSFHSSSQISNPHAFKTKPLDTRFHSKGNEQGFATLSSVHSVLGSDPLFRPAFPIYNEDCQCIPRQFCAAENVVARNNPRNLQNLIDARSKKTEILSIADELKESKTSNRRSKALAFDDDNSTVTEQPIDSIEVITELSEEETTQPIIEDETTEVPEIETAGNETSRVKRDAEEETEETEEEFPDRQGVSY